MAARWIREDALSRVVLVLLWVAGLAFFGMLIQHDLLGRLMGNQLTDVRSCCRPGRAATKPESD
jgi:hypothetical protein